MGRIVIAASALAFIAFGCGIEIVGKIDSHAGADGGPLPPGTTLADGGIATCNETSSQANCGACGHSCGSAACNGGLCTPEIILSDTSGLSGLSGLSSIAVDTKFVHAIIPTKIVSVPLGGGPVTTEMDTSRSSPMLPQPIALPLSGDAAYYVDSVGPFHIDQVVGGVGAGHGSQFFSGQGVGILVANDFVYTTSSTGMVQFYDLSLGDASAHQLAPATGTAQGLAVDKTDVYWANPTGGFIGRGKRGADNSGAPFIAGQTRPTTVVVDETNVYFTTPTEIRSAPKATAQAATLIPSLASPVGLALDGAFLYWIELTTGDLKRVGTGGGTPLLLAKGTAPIADSPYTSILAVSPTHVYWASPAAGSVSRVAK